MIFQDTVLDEITTFNYLHQHNLKSISFYKVIVYFIYFIIVIHFFYPDLKRFRRHREAPVPDNVRRAPDRPRAEDHH